jgi:hypothetical protein
MTDIKTYNYAKELIAKKLSKEEVVAELSTHGLTAEEADNIYTLLMKSTMSAGADFTAPTSSSPRTGRTLNIVLLCIIVGAAYIFFSHFSLRFRLVNPFSNERYGITRTESGGNGHASIESKLPDGATIETLDDTWELYKNPTYRFSIKIPRKEVVNVSVRRKDSYSAVLHQGLGKEATKLPTLRIFIGEVGTQYVEENKRQPKGTTVDRMVGGKPFFVWDSSTLILAQTPTNHILAQSDGKIASGSIDFYMAIQYTQLSESQLPESRKIFETILDSVVFE